MGVAASSLTSTSTWHKPKLFYHTVTAAEQTASGVTISISSGGSSDDWFFLAQCQRAGANVVTSITYTYASGTGDLTVGGPVLTSDELRVLGTFVS